MENSVQFYTGVGSRRTPKAILMIMYHLASKLHRAGYVLRSGGAEGADRVFENGSHGSAQIFRPEHATLQAIDLAARFHPAWACCSSYAKKLHGRNAFQVLGRDLKTPSAFLICWTPDGAINHAQRSIKTGGTGTAISIADYFNVPVFNIARQEHLERITRYITE